MAAAVKPRSLFGPGGFMGSRAEKSSDGYVDRLIKYVPAEVLAFFLPITAAVGPGRPSLIWVCLAAGFVATPIWLGVHALQMPAGSRPLPHFYVLACVAFVAWAIASSDAVRVVVGVDLVTANVILGVVVLILPGIDILLSAIGW